MFSRQQILAEISNVMKLDKPITVDTMPLYRGELDTLLEQVKCFNGAITDDPNIIRPPRQTIDQSFHKTYKRSMSTYLQERYGLSIRFSSLISSGAYNKIADWADNFSETSQKR